MDTIVRMFSQDLPVEGEVIVIGGGKFGRRAVERIGRKHPGVRLTVVDRDGVVLSSLRREVEGIAVETVEEDGIAFLLERDGTMEDGVWVVPSIPVHVSCEWMAGRLRREGCRVIPGVIPEAMRKRLPNVFLMPGRLDVLYTSVASFLCPDNCPEPKDRCTSTGEPRVGNLYEMIADAIPPSSLGVVFRSFQLAPGVGGYPWGHLRGAYHRIAALLEAGGGHPEPSRSLIVATACRCHGVVSAVSVER